MAKLRVVNKSNNILLFLILKYKNNRIKNNRMKNEEALRFLLVPYHSILAGKIA
jgi:hypothetical protein